MRRYLNQVILFIIILVILSGCHDAISTNLKPTPHTTVNDFTGVTMFVNLETVSSVGLSVQLLNKSKSQGLYGNEFALEEKIDNQWYQVAVAIQGNYGFDSLGYNLPAGDTGEWTVNWEWLYGKLKHGEYRLIKHISDFRATGDYDTYILAAEFILK